MIGSAAHQFARVPNWHPALLRLRPCLAREDEADADTLLASMKGIVRLIIESGIN